MSDQEYFKFVQALAADLNNADIQLPSFPDVVIRVRKALSDPNTTGRTLADILGLDAVLAARILVLANSTYHNPGGIRIESLEAAVGRIGFEQVRSAAISYAVQQLYAAKDLEPLKMELMATWSAGLSLAAMSEVIARRCTKLDGESAFIAGLIHRIGALYIFMKYKSYPDLLQDAGRRRALIDEWAAPIGQSIVAAWDFSAEIQASVNPDEEESGRRRSAANLADVVTMAKSFLTGGEIELPETPESKRLQIKAEQLPGIMESYSQKLESLAAMVR